MPPLLWLCRNHLFPQTVRLSWAFQRYSFPLRTSVSPCARRNFSRSTALALSIWLGCRPCCFLLKAPVFDFLLGFLLELRCLASSSFFSTDSFSGILPPGAESCCLFSTMSIYLRIFSGQRCPAARFPVGAQLCAAGLQRRKFGSQCRKIHRCAAVQLHQGADSFIKGVQFLFVLGGISVLGQLKVLLHKGIMDRFQFGMDGGGVLDLGDCRIRFSFCFNCLRRGATVWFKLSMAWFKSSAVFREWAFK